MKKFLSLILFITIASVTFSQTKGDFFVGTNSNLTWTSLSNLQLSTGIGYQVSDEWQVGGFTMINKQDHTSLYARWYPSKCIIKENVRAFMQGSFDTSFDAEYWGINLSTGVTGFLNKTIYVEPRIGLYWNQSTSDESLGFESSIGFGLRF